MNAALTAACLLRLEKEAVEIVRNAILRPDEHLSERRIADLATARIRGVTEDLSAALNLGEIIPADRRLFEAAREAVELFDTLCRANASKLRQMEPAIDTLRKLTESEGNA